MGCTLRELDARMTPREFGQWVAYFAVDGWTEERADLRNAILAYTVASMFGGKGQRVSLTDFMPDFYSEPKREPTPLERAEEIRTRMEVWLKAQGIPMEYRDDGDRRDN